jgi:hypothetical protein
MWTHEDVIAVDEARQRELKRPVAVAAIHRVARVLRERMEIPVAKLTVAEGPRT